MSSPSESVKARVRNMRPYSLTPEFARIKINQNENPWDVAVSIKQETLARAHARAWSRYPDFVPASLHERLAAFAGWKADGVIAGNGSNELIQALMMVTVGEGVRVLISEPTFALYRQIATILGGEIISVPLTPEFAYDFEGLRKAIEANRPALTIICSPNNPTGSVIANDDLSALAEAAQGLIVIDEAYFEFAQQTAMPLLERYPNLVVLRTFSKAMAMAALRVGYLLAAPELALEISKAVLPYNLNALSQAAAEIAVEKYEIEIEPLVKKIISEREKLYRELSRIQGLIPVRSRGNFMIVRSAITPRSVFNELLKHDILIRDVSGYPGLKDYFRVSVGTPAENDMLVAALSEIFI